MIGRAKEHMKHLEPPSDTTITTLYVGGVTPDISESDLKDEFYAYGEIKSIRLVPQSHCAFVTYTTRDAAEEAAERLANRLIVKGIRLKLMWGKPKIRDDPKPGAATTEFAIAGPVGVPSTGLPASSISPAAGGYSMPAMPSMATATQISYPSMDG